MIPVSDGLFVKTGRAKKHFRLIPDAMNSDSAETTLTSHTHSVILVYILVDQKGDHIMKTLSVSEAKMKLSGLVDSVYTTDEEVVITKNGSPVAVLISPDEFEGWKETVAIRSDAEFMDEIKKGLATLKKGKVKLYTLDELFNK